MKHRRMLAALAAMMMLTVTGCAQTEEMTATNDIALEEPAVREEAVMEAADEDMAVAEEAPAAAAAADDAAGAAPEGEASYRTKGDAAGDDASPAEFGAAEFSAVAGSPMMDGASYDGAFGMEYGGADVDIAPVEPEPETVDRTAEIGVLTAGEWSDHNNWGFFSNLVNSDLIAFPSYGLDPTQRIAVTVKDAAGAPAPNTKVQLLDDTNAPIWTAVTGKDGVAYLFAANGKNAQSVTIEGAVEAVTLPPVEGEQQGNIPKCSDRAVELTVTDAPVALPNTQIMFLVDTTGSMGDEMLYLQSDFSAIAEEVGDEHTEYATLFYKDDGDSYVTKYDGFTTDAAEIRTRLNAEFADGGGDFPEAVAQAFTQGFVEENWRDDAVKIAFLIFDAPPHDGTDAELQTAIEAAAAKGIHLVPVVSSNSERETELFGRACAILTNGSYVFLTDDSGVGGSHLEPIIGDYEVEKLHDIIVRIVQDYKQ